MSFQDQKAAAARSSLSKAQAGQALAAFVDRLQTSIRKGTCSECQASGS